MSRSQRHGYWYEFDTRFQKPPPHHRKEWRRLQRVAKELGRLIPMHFEGDPIPYMSSNDVFLTWVTNFADADRREILRKLVFDLMYEDLKKLFIAHAERMHPEWSQKKQQTA